MGKDKITEKKIQEKKINKEDYQLRIYPVHSVFLKEAVIVSFQGERQFYRQDTGHTRSSTREQYIPITPTFNADYKHYTSSFILPKQIGDQSDEQMKLHHQSKVLQSQREIDAPQILVPKPKSQNKYCAVCHSRYDDYLSHIQAVQHKKNIKKSKFNSYIEYITLFVNEQANMERDRVMTRSAKRKGDHLWIDYQLEDKTNKKRKGDTARMKKSLADKEEEYQTAFNKSETTIKSLLKELD